MTTLLFLLQDAHVQTVPDSTLAQAAADSAARYDSLSALGGLSREIGDVSRDIVSGNFDGIARLTETFVDRIIGVLPNLVGALFVFLLLYAIYRVAGYLLHRALTKARRVDLAVETLLMKTYRVTGLAIILVMVIAQFGVNITALIAGLSVVGIAVGFAAQDTVSNFISGVTILMDKPFKVGHFIEIEDVRGTVTDITLRSTRLRTLNNKLMVLPNSHMINQKLINHTFLGIVRVEIPFGIAYKESPDAARTAILQAIGDDARLHPDYPPTVVVDALADSSINMVLRAYLKDPFQEINVRFEYVEKVREVLREAGIEIPFPHLQLHIDSAKGLKQ